jgi:hypothetical protein
MAELHMRSPDSVSDSRRTDCLRITAIVATLGAATLTSACSGGSGTPGTDSTPAVMAKVGPDAVVTQREVEDSATLVVGGGPVLDLERPCARTDADVSRAVDDELLSLWAVAEGLAPASNSRAERIAAARAQLDSTLPSTLSEDDAAAWLSARESQFARVQTAEVTWAKFNSPRSAWSALGKSAGPVDPATVPALSPQSGTARLAHDGSGADGNVARVAFALRRAGSVGYTFDGTNAWLVGITSIENEPPSSETGRAQQLRRLATEGAREDAIAAFAWSLRDRWPVEILKHCTPESAILGR